MEAHHHNKPSEELLGKYLAGEATPEEALRIDDWINNAANKTELAEMVKLWSLSGGQFAPTTPSLTTVWSEIQLALGKNKPQTTVRSLLINRYTVAACFIGLIVILFFVVSKKKSVVTDAGQRVTEIRADSLQNIVLPDNSSVSMTKKSSIHYDSSFNLSHRSIRLEGESYFKITHNALQPFIITIGALSIKVIGTAFNVCPVVEHNRIEVQVESGIVQMLSPAGTIIVKKEQTGIYNTVNHELRVAEGIDPNSMSYATKSFLFRDLPLSVVCNYLEKSFNTRIQFDEKVFNECRITAQFDNSPLNYILDVIAATINFKYTIKNNQVFIQGKGCN
jgi:transmembrane sensor